MLENPDITGLDAVILAGGLGTRLRPVINGLPKCLASVADTPFLTYKILQLKAAGVRRVVLCVGYLSEHIQDYFQQHPIPGVELAYAFEEALLGTAGAFKNAEAAIESEHFIALNGDCYLDIDYRAFVNHHFSAGAVASLALVPVADPSRYGLVHFDEKKAIQAFLEKQDASPAQAGPHYINAGTYCLHRSVLQRIPPGEACSIERDIFPGLIGQGFQAYPMDGYFIDIGTPESYAQIEQDIRAGKLQLVS